MNTQLKPQAAFLVDGIFTGNDPAFGCPTFIRFDAVEAMQPNDDFSCVHLLLKSGRKFVAQFPQGSDDGAHLVTAFLEGFNHTKISDLEVAQRGLDATI